MPIILKERTKGFLFFSVLNGGEKRHGSFRKLTIITLLLFDDRRRHRLDREFNLGAPTTSHVLTRSPLKVYDDWYVDDKQSIDNHFPMNSCSQSCKMTSSIVQIALMRYVLPQKLARSDSQAQSFWLSAERKGIHPVFLSLQQAQLGEFALLHYHRNDTHCLSSVCFDTDPEKNTWARGCSTKNAPKPLDRAWVSGCYRKILFKSIASKRSVNCDTFGRRSALMKSTGHIQHEANTYSKHWKVFNLTFLEVLPRWALSRFAFPLI